MNNNDLSPYTGKRRASVFWGLVGLFILLAAVGLFGGSAFAEEAGSSSSPFSTVPPGGTVPLPLLSKLTVIHAAPFTNDVDASGVDICTDDNLPVINLANLKYLQQKSTYLMMGEYNLKASQAGAGCSGVLIDIDPFAVANGGEYLLILTGDGVNQPFDSLLITIEQGSGNYYLPLIYR